MEFSISGGKYVVLFDGRPPAHSRLSALKDSKNTSPAPIKHPRTSITFSCIERVFKRAFSDSCEFGGLIFGLQFLLSSIANCLTVLFEGQLVEGKISLSPS